MKFDFSIHALEQLAIRGISRAQILEVLENPNQVFSLEGEKEIRVYQSLFGENEGETYLIRVFVNQIKSPNLIITAYRTTKVQKYWKYEGSL